MILHVVLSVLLGVVQTVAQPPVAPPAAPPAVPPAAPSAPAAPEVKPAEPAPAEPAGAKPAASAVLDLLEPVSRRAVEKHSAYFIVTQDGKYWDRQVWLQRQELRDRLKRSSSLPPTRSDAQRALGASKDAPADPNDPADGIKLRTWIVKTGETKKGYFYGVDRTNAPMWRAADGTVAVTGDEIHNARNVQREKMSISERIADTKANGGGPAAIREVVTAEELAVAIRDGKAELSEFRWTKRVIEKSKVERRNASGGVTQGAEPEEAEYSWFRTEVPVRWLKEKPAAPGDGKREAEGK